MNAMAIKGRLHEYIETADSEHLAAMYVVLQKDMAPSNQYDEDTLKMLYQRVEDDMKGLSKSYTVAEAMASIRISKDK